MLDVLARQLADLVFARAQRIEDLTRGRLGSAFSDLVVFLILIVFMLVRPQGILGKPEVKKV